MNEKFFKLLANIFNWCLKTSYFPMKFKNAKVIPILKPGKDEKLPTSYRPISMLNVIDKIFEKIILARVTKFAEDNEILHKHQFGFRKGFSTVHQIKRIEKMVQANKISRKSTGVILLDIEKAFDSVWHNGIIFKLNEFKFPIYLQKIIRSFLEKRCFSVHIHDGISTLREICAGVPQGSVLSPTLYSIFTSDFKSLKEQSVAFYADDSAIITNGKVSNAIVKRMKKALVSAQNYFLKWKIKINHNKTQAILFPFNKSPKRTPTQTLFVENINIPLQDSVKYLGIIYDKKLNFKKHIDYTCEKAIKCGRALYSLLNRKSSLNFQNKMLLYNMCIRPIMSYGCQIWFPKCAKTNLKKLQIIQNKNLKIILNLHRRYPTKRLHDKYNQIPINDLFQKLTLRFEDNCRSSNYVEIRNLFD